MSKKRAIVDHDPTYNTNGEENSETVPHDEQENLIAKSRKIDTEVAESSTMFASITQSDDEGDSSFEFVKNESMSDEPYTSQLRTPPKLNDTLDDSVDEYLGVSSSRIIQDGRHDSREVLFGDHEDEDNEDGSGGGSSAASTAADIMREMLEEFPRSNDTLVINSREESDEDEIDQDFQYNEKFEMMLQDDASPSLPHGFDEASSSSQLLELEGMETPMDSFQSNDCPIQKKAVEKRHRFSSTSSSTKDERQSQIYQDSIDTAISRQPPLPIGDVPPLPQDKEKRPPSPPSEPQYLKGDQNTDTFESSSKFRKSDTTDQPTTCEIKVEYDSTVDASNIMEIEDGDSWKENSQNNVNQEKDIKPFAMGEGGLNEDYEDEYSENEDIAHDLLDADLNKKVASAEEEAKEKKKEPHEKIRSFLVDRGKNHFTVLPEGWIQVRHFSGMPVYLHKQTRVVTLSKPYVLGPLSVKSHHIPLGSIPCLNYRKAKEEEETLRSKMGLEASNSNEHGMGSNEVPLKAANFENGGNGKKLVIENKGCPFNSNSSNESSKHSLSAKFPMAKISSLKETKKTKSLSPEEFKNYCANLFEFRDVKMKSFPNWKQKRLYNKEVNAKRLKAQVKKSMEKAAAAQKTPKKEGEKLEKPTLPDFKLLTIPVLEMQKNDDTSKDDSAFNRKITKKSRKEWVFNPKNKTPVCILHEYLQHSIRQPPEYKYSEIDSPKTPYSAVVLIQNIEYGKGVGTSKKQAKSEAARVTLEILIPNFMKEIGPEIQGGSSTLNELPDVSYFDKISVLDARVSDLCMRIGEPSPYAVLMTCLQKNYDYGQQNVEQNLVPRKNKKNEFTMKVNGRTVSVICKNKKDGKQLASQKLLQLIHPQIETWGSLLRLYGSTAIQAQKLKKERESEVTVLQSRHSSHPSPSQAILEKLKEEMRKLAARKKDALPIGKLTIPGTFPGVNYGAIGVAEK